MRTICDRFTQPFTSGILYHGARGEGWRAWPGILRARNYDTGSVTVSLRHALTQELVAQVALTGEQGASSAEFLIPQPYTVEFEGVSGSISVTVVVDGDTGSARASPIQPIALYDFTAGDVPDLIFETLVAGAVSRDSLTFVSSGTQRRTDATGLMSERQITNKCTNTNLKPTDTSGTTPDAAWTTHEAVARDNISSISPGAATNLLSIDPQGNVTGVYHSVSNGAGTISVSGVTGNSNTHTGTHWLYVLSGTIRVRLSGSVTFVDVTPSDNWLRAGVVELLPGAAETLIIESLGAAECLWFGSQLEENNARSSLIEVSGATATRLGDNVRVDTVAGLDVNAFAVVVELVTFAQPSGSFARSLSLDNGANVAAEQMESSITTGNQFSVTANEASVVAGTYTPQSIAVHAFGNDNGTLNSAADGIFLGSGAFTAPGSYPRTRFGSRPAAISQLNGYVRRVAVFDVAGTAGVVTALSGIAAGGPGFSLGFDDGFN